MALPAVRSRLGGQTANRSGDGNPPAVWDPFRDLTELQETFGRLVESVFGSTVGSVGPVGAGGFPAFQGWRPPADLSETDAAYVLEVEVPGLKRDDVTIELNRNELVVHGEYQERERTGVLRHRTRRSGRFEYRAVLPSDVDADSVTAELADGVLTVTVPKTEAAKPRRIEITTH